ERAVRPAVGSDTQSYVAQSQRAVPVPGPPPEPRAARAAGALSGFGARVLLDLPQPDAADAGLRARLQRLHAPADPELPVLHVRGPPALDLVRHLGDQRRLVDQRPPGPADRKSTRLNSSHVKISYA